jgi:hypothetical protein
MIKRLLKKTAEYAVAIPAVIALDKLTEAARKIKLPLLGSLFEYISDAIADIFGSY